MATDIPFKDILTNVDLTGHEKLERLHDIAPQLFHWTYSINFNFELGRTLVVSGGLNDYLPFAPAALPIIQVTELHWPTP